MTYGRVIGIELRDVPPECLPVWGQRWSGYCPPRGPSPFSTRVFSVDRMSEVGPALTSPTQFEMMLTDEDEGEDTSSESSRPYGFFSSSPSVTRTGATELVCRDKTPTPRSVHRLANRFQGAPQSHQNSGRPPPTSPHSGTPLPNKRKSNQSNIQHSGVELPLYSPPLHYGVQSQDGCGSFANDLGLSDMGHISMNVQYGDGPFTHNFAHEGQQHTGPSHSVPECHFATHTLPDTGLIRTTHSFSSHYFTPSSLQQNVGVNPPPSYESGIAEVLGTSHSQKPLAAHWSPVSVPHSLPFSELQYSGSSTDLAWMTCHLASDYRKSSGPEDLDGFPYSGPENYALLSLDNPTDAQLFTG